MGLSLLVLSLFTLPSGTPPARMAPRVRNLLEVSEAVRRAGRPADAMRIIELAEPLIAPDSSPAERLRLRLQRVRCGYYSQSLAGAPYEASIEELRALLGEAERLEDALLLSDIRDLLGLAIYSRDFRRTNLEEPRRLFERALAARRDAVDRRRIAESLFHVGLTWENKKDPSAEELQRARASHEQALAIAEADGLDIEASYAERHLAGHRQDAGDLDGALAGFERSLALRAGAGYHIYLAPALLAVGDVWKDKRDAAKARGFYERALAEADRLGAARFQQSAREALRALEPKAQAGSSPAR